MTNKDIVVNAIFPLCRFHSQTEIWILSETQIYESASFQLCHIKTSRDPLCHLDSIRGCFLQLGNARTRTFSSGGFLFSVDDAYRLTLCRSRVFQLAGWTAVASRWAFPNPPGLGIHPKTTLVHIEDKRIQLHI